VDEVPPRRVRLRVVAGRALVVGVYLLVMGGLALVGALGGVSRLVFVAIGLLPTYLMVFIGGLDGQQGDAEITETRLTVATATGRRTLDLTALRSLLADRLRPAGLPGHPDRHPDPGRARRVRLRLVRTSRRWWTVP
jgi:hypothetical protein